MKKRAKTRSRSFVRLATDKEWSLYRKALHSWRGPVLPSSEAKRKKLSPGLFDSNQLAIGIGVELEHTRVPSVAMEIAMMHLSERADYYTLLEKMEKKR